MSKMKPLNLVSVAPNASLLMKNVNGEASVFCNRDLFSDKYNQTYYGVEGCVITFFWKEYKHLCKTPFRIVS